MKTYRIQARSGGSYYDVKLEANTDPDALLGFKKMIDEGTVKPDLNEGFYIEGRTFITFEEVKDGTATISSEQTRSGTSMGKESDDIAT
jgi:hypothetical protein